MITKYLILLVVAGVLSGCVRVTVVNVQHQVEVHASDNYVDTAVDAKAGVMP